MLTARVWQVLHLVGKYEETTIHVMKVIHRGFETKVRRDMSKTSTTGPTKCRPQLCSGAVLSVRLQ